MPQGKQQEVNAGAGTGEKEKQGGKKIREAHFRCSSSFLCRLPWERQKIVCGLLKNVMVSALLTEPGVPPATVLRAGLPSLVHAAHVPAGCHRV